jgi:hypothetical protein
LHDLVRLVASGCNDRHIARDRKELALALRRVYLDERTLAKLELCVGQPGRAK